METKALGRGFIREQGLPGARSVKVSLAASGESTRKRSCQSTGACSEGVCRQRVSKSHQRRPRTTPSPTPAAYPDILTASGRLNFARRKISGLGPAGRDRLNAAIASGRALAAPSTRCLRRPMQPAPSRLGSPARASRTQRPISARAGTRPLRPGPMSGERRLNAYQSVQ